MFTDSAADENQLQKMRGVRDTHSECDEFDEKTPLTRVAENMTDKNRGTHSDSSEGLTTKTRRNPKIRFTATARRTVHLDL